MKYVGMALLMPGFLLWGYGFVFGSFWYASAGSGLMEPLRVWADRSLGVPLLPGTLEKAFGLIMVIAGMFLQAGFFDRKRERKRDKRR